MLTDTLRAPATPSRFTLQAVAWSLGLFGLLRLNWVELQVLLPFTRVQGRLASGLVGAPTFPIETTLACSGADAMALCLAAVLAYPVSWRARLSGAAGAAMLILGLNTLRIGTLGRAASPAWFHALHVYVWPAILTLAIAAYVFTWMHFADARGVRRSDARVQPARRFAVLTAVLLLLFLAAAPLYLESARMLLLAELVARAAAAVLRVMGIAAHAGSNLLSTPRGSFLVTQECVSTPLIPVYLAAVLVYSRAWWTRTLWIAASLPLFVGLGIARLLVVALPPAINSSPAFLIHTFSQLLVGIGVVGGVALWRHGARAATLASVVVALTFGTAFLILAGAPYTHGILWLSDMSRAIPDPQGALAFLPAFQVALLLACWIAAFRAQGWMRLVFGLMLLAASQVAFEVGVQAVVHLGLSPSVPFIRAWALLGPALVLTATAGTARPHARVSGSNRYRAFWDRVGAEFPDLGGAASTALYRENEKRLIRTHLSALQGKRVLKTDLWDEARNTRILQWIGSQGAQVVGVDISRSVVRMVRGGVLAATADVRALPFGTATFDAVYSMGTIEHFAETEAAVGEIYRVLKPGGRAIIGVPNRHDPFLRPLMVAMLYRLGLYGYGFEKSYSRRNLQAMLQTAGFVIAGDDGILFIPGWLRMLDLLCYTRCRPAARFTSAAVRVFAWVDAQLPQVRRHGYLVVAIGERPGQD